mmetsp:Transcript_94343/g.250569  ORF Transcript_94343/g.250569 Transcript_94343/m.250569 type:complete len:262 (+) Transcript_94343:125-910(+)
MLRRTASWLRGLPRLGHEAGPHRMPPSNAPASSLHIRPGRGGQRCCVVRLVGQCGRGRRRLSGNLGLRQALVFQDAADGHCRGGDQAMRTHGCDQPLAKDLLALHLHAHAALLADVPKRVALLADQAAGLRPVHQDLQGARVAGGLEGHAQHRQDRRLPCGGRALQGDHAVIGPLRCLLLLEHVHVRSSGLADLLQTRALLADHRARAMRGYQHLGCGLGLVHALALGSGCMHRLVRTLVRARVLVGVAAARVGRDREVPA